MTDEPERETWPLWMSKDQAVRLTRELMKAGAKIVLLTEEGEELIASMPQENLKLRASDARGLRQIVTQFEQTMERRSR
jgi:hypothetical protein